jgi:predicted regulator of Ras-like GTPase activity (Roadblock/LC7/MglB family)
VIPTVTDNRLGWLLDRALQDVSGTEHGVLLSTDGLLMAFTHTLHRNTAEPLAAGLCAVASLARQNSQHFGDGPSGWRQTVNEYDGGYLLLTPAGPGALLGFLAATHVNLGDLTLRLHRLVQQVGQELASPPRQDTGSSA